MLCAVKLLYIGRSRAEFVESHVMVQSLVNTLNCLYASKSWLTSHHMVLSRMCDLWFTYYVLLISVLEVV